MLKLFIKTLLFSVIFLPWHAVYADNFVDTHAKKGEKWYYFTYSSSDPSTIIETGYIQEYLYLGVADPDNLPRVILNASDSQNHRVMAGFFKSGAFLVDGNMIKLDNITTQESSNTLIDEIRGFFCNYDSLGMCNTEFTPLYSLGPYVIDHETNSLLLSRSVMSDPIEFTKLLSFLYTGIDTFCDQSSGNEGSQQCRFVNNIVKSKNLVPPILLRTHWGGSLGADYNATLIENNGNYVELTIVDYMLPPSPPMNLVAKIYRDSPDTFCYNDAIAGNFDTSGCAFLDLASLGKDDWIGPPVLDSGKSSSSSDQASDNSNNTPFGCTATGDGELGYGILTIMAMLLAFYLYRRSNL